MTGSGEDGTEGYMKVTISKDLVSDHTKLRIRSDSDFVDFTLKEIEYSYVLYLSYHHSTHDAFAYLDCDDGAEEDHTLMELLVSMVIVMAVMGALMIALVRRKDRP